MGSKMVAAKHCVSGGNCHVSWEDFFKNHFCHLQGFQWFQDFLFVEIEFKYWERLFSLHLGVSDRQDGMAFNNFSDCPLKTMAGLGVPALPEILLVCDIFKG